MNLDFLLHIFLLQTEFSKSPKGRLASPQGIPDYIIVAVSVLVVIVSLFLLIKYFVQPKEKDENHIKRVILKDDFSG